MELSALWVKDGGPRWEKVWKRATYNPDTGDLIAEELVSDMTKKDLNRPLPEKVKNIRTVLYCRATGDTLRTR
eukprot:2994154-Amphidinium_carterae.1